MATLINGNGNLAIYAQQDADWYAALMGGQTVITAVGNQFAYELLASNTIGVKDGVIITSEGRRIQLDANAIDSFDIPTGAQGTTNYYIIGYHLVTGNQSEQTCETFVQLMENGTDTIPEGSFRDGDDEVFVSLYRVEQDDLTIGTITLLLPQLSGSFQSQISQLNNDLTDKVERMTDVSGYQTVDVLGYNPITKNLGLKVNGADTVIPFSRKEIIYLGNGTSFDLKSYSDYSDFTESNFICEINSETGYVSANANYDSAYATSSISLNKTYNPATGILNASATLQTQVHQGSGHHFYQTQNKVVTVKAYLILN